MKARDLANRARPAAAVVFRERRSGASGMKAGDLANWAWQVAAAVVGRGRRSAVSGLSVRDLANRAPAAAAVVTRGPVIGVGVMMAGDVAGPDQPAATLAVLGSVAGGQHDDQQ